MEDGQKGRSEHCFVGIRTVIGVVITTESEAKDTSPPEVSPEML